MNLVQKNLYPGGRRRALTFSYDDGVIHDERLIEIFNRFGVKGTFHLNSGKLDREGCLSSADVERIYRGHEISVHSVQHPHLETLPPEQLAWQILEDRRKLEGVAGYPVRGMSYPFGTYDDAVLKRLPAYGIEYARTTKSHGTFNLPANFLEWHPTCHHKMDILAKAAEFLDGKVKARPLIFSVWGHSFEFARANNWDLMEKFCETVAASRDSVWFATYMEIVDYFRAVEQTRFSADGRLIQNFSSMAVWISVNGEAVEVPPGEILRLA